MSTAPQPKRIVVVGAGIVGVSTGLHLQREGHSVTLVDPTPPGRGTSFGNAGSIAIGSVYPTGSPGNWKQVPKMLTDPMSPLRIKWSYVLKAAPWFWHFLEASRESRVEEISHHLWALSKDAMTSHRKLIELTRAHDIVKPVGWLKVYSSQQSLDKTKHEREVMTRRGVKFDVLTADEIRQLEPGLSPKFTHGYHQPENGFVSEPVKLTEAYFAKFKELGGRWVPEKVRRFAMGPNGVEKVVTDLAMYPCDAVVVCAGARSHEIVAMLGRRFPLDTERGYHLNLTVQEGPELRRATVIGDHGFVLAPMQDGLRLTTGAEFAGVDAPPDFRRIYRMLELAHQALPGLKAEVTREWLGFRPSTPDSVPVIGRSPDHANVYYGFGHGHIGLTLAARTGELVSDLVAGRDPGIDLTPYRIERY
ncbi:FAD-dependent oxidoreductase [Thalassobaculum sp.]|uniref:NAD(P)/FAD-dependent oxidoreductase n=1 Tax=Thalassobaculum sp. TaxID=2022740 RepID=UPI0032EEDD30